MRWYCSSPRSACRAKVKFATPRPRTRVACRSALQDECSRRLQRCAAACAARKGGCTRAIHHHVRKGVGRVDDAQQQTGQMPAQCMRACACAARVFKMERGVVRQAKGKEGKRGVRACAQMCMIDDVAWNSHNGSSARVRSAMRAQITIIAKCAAAGRRVSP